MHDLARCALAAGDRVLDGHVAACADGTLTFDADHVAAIRDRRGRPGTLYAAWDGVLVSQMLNDEANAFTRDCYARFLQDDDALFSEAGPYGVRGSWQDCDRIAPVLDERLAQWRAHPVGGAEPHVP